MANPYDFPKFSTFVNSIVDRKVRALSVGISTSTGYFKNFILQAQAAAQESSDFSETSQAASLQAQTASSQTQIIWNGFNSTYAGILTQDPLKNALGNNFVKGAFYVKSDNLHLRVVTNVDGNGNPTWQNVVTIPNLQTVRDAVAGLYLILSTTDDQTVQGPVSFTNPITVPAITNWTTNYAPRASDVNTLVNGVKTLINQEIQRAQEAEQSGVVFTQQEIARAQAAEAALQLQINNVATSVENETSRRENADLDLQNQINAEIQRATNSVAGIQTIINNFLSQFSNGSNANGSWEIRPGIVEMWGVVPAPFSAASSEGSVSIAFPLTLADNNYVLHVSTDIASASSTADTWVQSVQPTKSPSGFTAQVQASKGGYTPMSAIEWRVIYRGTVAS